MQLIFNSKLALSKIVDHVIKSEVVINKIFETELRPCTFLKSAFLHQNLLKFTPK